MVAQKCHCLFFLRCDFCAKFFFSLRLLCKVFFRHCDFCAEFVFATLRLLCRVFFRHCNFYGEIFLQLKKNSAQKSQRRKKR